MNFDDIPQFTQSADYAVDVGWTYFPEWFRDNVAEYGLDVDPPFQRGHVWVPEQRTRYIEYILKGGHSSRDIYCNDPNWHYGKTKQYVLVDGKQRIDAVLGFLNNEVEAFGKLYREFEGKLRMAGPSLRWHVNTLKTYQEVLQWYLDLNTGGTVHTEQELSKVRTMLEQGQGYDRPGKVELAASAGLDRALFQRIKDKPLPPVAPVRKRGRK